MKHLTERLDRIASECEAQGLRKLAARIDLVSNSLEAEAGMRRQAGLLSFLSDGIKAIKSKAALLRQVTQKDLEAFVSANPELVKELQRRVETNPDEAKKAEELMGGELPAFLKPELHTAALLGGLRGLKGPVLWMVLLAFSANLAHGGQSNQKVDLNSPFGGKGVSTLEQHTDSHGGPAVHPGTDNNRAPSSAPLQTKYQGAIDKGLDKLVSGGSADDLVKAFGSLPDNQREPALNHITEHLADKNVPTAQANHLLHSLEGLPHGATHDTQVARTSDPHAVGGLVHGAEFPAGKTTVKTFSDYDVAFELMNDPAFSSHLKDSKLTSFLMQDKSTGTYAVVVAPEGTSESAAAAAANAPGHQAERG